MISTGSIDKHLYSLSAKGFSPNTIRAYRADLNGWLTWLEDHGHDSDDWSTLELDAAAYLTAHRTTWAPKTTVRKLGAIRTWAKANDQPKFLVDYRPPTPGDPDPHPLDEGMDGIVLMCRLAPNHEQTALIALCGLCGLRVAEALRTRPSDIDLGRRKLTVRGKGDKVRQVPISTAALTYMAGAYGEAFPGDDQLVRLEERYARGRVTLIAKHAGISRPVASHDLRATFATTIYRRTKDIRLVQRLLGHASVVTTQLYIGIHDDDMRQAVEI